MSAMIVSTVGLLSHKVVHVVGVLRLIICFALYKDYASSHMSYIVVPVSI